MERQDGQAERAGALIETEALIVGAGPAGLFCAFELGLLEIGVHIVDSLPQAGGQCAELYAGKPIYDIPGLPVCSGQELSERLLQQIAPFKTPLHLKQQVSGLKKRDDGRFDVETSLGTRFTAGAVVIAGGVGSFQPRRLKVAGLEPHYGTQVFESGEGALERGTGTVVIVGNGEAAVTLAITLAAPSDAGSSPARAVMLVHRRDDFDAPPDRLAELQRLRDASRIVFVAGQPEAIVERDGRLRGISLLTADGASTTVGLDALYVLLGWSPKLGPIGEWGLALEKKQLVVDTERFETSTPGIHAIGDVNTYPGKKKLIVCGFHEATLAAFAIAQRLHPERAQPLQYTTTSPKLHKLLGV